MAKGAAAGKTFLQGILAKLPEGLRADAARVFETVELQTAVGDGTLALEDFTRQSDELTAHKTALEALQAKVKTKDEELATWHGELTAWYGVNKDLIELGKTAQGGDPSKPNGGKKVEEPVAFTPKDYDERIAAERASFLGFQRDQNLLTRQHFTHFGEILDLEPLLKHPQIAQVGLVGAYELVHKERLDKHKADTQAAHDKKIADKAVQDYQQANAQMPYPPLTGAGSGSPLDALTAKASPVVDAAVEHYNRLTAERAAGGRPSA